MAEPHVAATTGAGEYVLDAPIVAVTVYPDRARVSRRGRLTLPAGEHQVLCDNLPLQLQEDSVRVAGRGPATVLGVDLTRRYQARTSDDVAERMEEELRQARAQLASLDDEDAVAAGRLEFLTGLARRAAGAYARALARRESDPAGVAQFGDEFAAQQVAVRETRRALAERRDRIREQIAAYERSLEARSRQRQPDHLAAVVTLHVAAADPVEADPVAPVGGAAPARSAGPVEIELDLSYVVEGAGWHSAYDLRLDGETLALTWYGLITQHTAEDWPECDLSLSTARPAGGMTVPELDPWFLDRVRPVMAAPPMARAAHTAGVAVTMAAPAAPMSEAGAVAESAAEAEQGVAAATYRPARPVAVPADGATHRATVAVAELSAALDYVTAPVQAEEVHLRATVTNSSPHTLLPGRAAVFHQGDFVGTAALKVWAPGEEVELALGLDDRVRVERKLVRRSASKPTLGSTRRQETEHRIAVTNHSPRPARVTVLDQLPVSRDAGITVRELRLDPAPAERSEVGLLTWRLELEPGDHREIFLGVRVEIARGVELAGWRE